MRLASSGATQAQANGGLREFISFHVGEECFASPMEQVQEIIRVPSVARLPMAPPAVLGLGSLRGRVLPMLSMRKLLGMEGAPVGESSRAVVTNLGTEVGFVVDRVSSVISAEDGQIESAEGLGGSAANRGWLTGVIRSPEGLAVLVDFGRVLEGLNGGGGGPTAPGRLAETRRAEKVEREAGDQSGFVTFSVCGQEYAVPISIVEEIVQAPSEVVRLPDARPHLLGMTCLRSRTLPLFSMHLRLGFAAPAADPRQRVIVVSLAGRARAAFVVDSVAEVLSAGCEEMEPAPPQVKGNGEGAVLAALIRPGGGSRLISVLDPAALLAGCGEGPQDAPSPERRSAMEDGRLEAAMTEDGQFVVFQLGREEFGLKIDSVQEIVRVPDRVVRIPKAPPWVEGVINLRGVVLPVLDLRRKFELPAGDRTERQRILVCSIGGERAGFVVDSVSEVRRIPDSAIQAAPAVAAGPARIVEDVASLDQGKRLLFLIGPDRLLGEAEVREVREALGGGDAGESARG